MSDGYQATIEMIKKKPNQKWTLANQPKINSRTWTKYSRGYSRHAEELTKVYSKKSADRSATEITTRMKHSSMTPIEKLLSYLNLMTNQMTTKTQMRTWSRCIPPENTTCRHHLTRHRRCKPNHFLHPSSPHPSSPHPLLHALEGDLETKWVDQESN